MYQRWVNANAVALPPVMLLFLIICCNAMSADILFFFFMYSLLYIFLSYMRACDSLVVRKSIDDNTPSSRTRVGNVIVCIYRRRERYLCAYINEMYARRTDE